MAFAAAALWFLVPAAFNAFIGATSLRRWSAGREQKWQWQWSRVMVAMCALASGMDSLRIFAGGFWAESTASSPPWFAMSIYPLLVLHLVAVPLCMMPNTEYCCAIRPWKALQEGAPIPVDDSRGDRIARWVTVLVSVVFAVMGVINCVGRMQAGAAVGMHRKVIGGGIVTFLLPDSEEAHALGFMHVPGELAGVFAFAFWGILTGVCIWKRTGFCSYLVLTVLTFLGQGGSIALRPWNSFLSNPLEALGFAGMLYMDCLFFEVSKDSDAPLSGSAEVGVEMGG